MLRLNHINQTGIIRDPDARLPHMGGLDGLRAIAVIAVMLYHAGLSVWGGFLGVETFFVLSGFLITSLLLVDWRTYNRVRLSRFWLRRARRLLPALFLLLIGTVIMALVRLSDEAAQLNADVLAALAYVMNWHLIATQQSYFDPMIRPPLLQHLWSLAVEEQFYLIWPLVFAAGMRFLRLRGLLLATIATALASALLLALLYQPGADPSRVYYGTDTRVSALLIGAALAMVWTPGRAPLATHRSAGYALDLLGGAALIGLLVGYLRLYESDPLLYRGGFALVAIGTAIVIAAVTHPQARVLPRVLSFAPLRWIGLRSYGLYLWHYPIFMLTRPYLDVTIDGWQLLLVRFGLALLITELSYRLVEVPIRRGVLGNVWQRVFTARSQASGYSRTPVQVADGAALSGTPGVFEPVSIRLEDAPPTHRRYRAGAANNRRRHHRRR